MVKLNDILCGGEQDEDACLAVLFSIVLDVPVGAVEKNPQEVIKERHKIAMTKV